jgi:hypothetical protein
MSSSYWQESLSLRYPLTPILEDEYFGSDDCDVTKFNDVCDVTTFDVDCEVTKFNDDCEDTPFNVDFEVTKFNVDCDVTKFNEDCDATRFNDDCDVTTFGEDVTKMCDELYHNDADDEDEEDIVTLSQTSRHLFASHNKQHLRFESEVYETFESRPKSLKK